MLIEAAATGPVKPKMVRACYYRKTSQEDEQDLYLPENGWYEKPKKGRFPSGRPFEVGTTLDGRRGSKQTDGNCLCQTGSR